MSARVRLQRFLLHRRGCKVLPGRVSAVSTARQTPFCVARELANTVKPMVFHYFSRCISTPLRRTEHVPSRPKTPPRRPQDAHKMAQDVPKTPQDAPKTPQDAPKTLPRRPKAPPDAHQTPQDAPRTHPRRPKAPPRRPEDAPRRPQDAPKTFPRRISPCPTGQGILRERFHGCRSTSVVQSCERRHWPKAFTIVKSNLD